MREDEIIERIQILIKASEFGIQTFKGDNKKIFKLDKKALEGLLDLYQKEKQTNEELRKICYGKALEDLDTSRIYEEEQRKQKNMKEMIYSSKRKREVLATGYCFGLLYFILNLGTHPTAYIKLPDNLEIDKDEIDVHGGITYSEDYLFINDIVGEIHGKFIGWDYAHYNDFVGYYTPNDDALYMLKRWTTEEIYKEVREVCYQIKKMGEDK